MTFTDDIKAEISRIRLELKECQAEMKRLEIQVKDYETALMASCLCSGEPTHICDACDVLQRWKES